MKENNYRYIITQDDKAKIVSLYNLGRSMSEISELLNFSPETIKKIIKSETGNYTEYHPNFLKADKLKKTPRLSEEKIKTKVINLFNKGNSIDYITETIKFVPKTKIEKILVENNLIQPRQNPEENSSQPIATPIEKFKIDEFKKQCKIGDKFEIEKELRFYDDIVEVYTITALYKNFAMTDKGTMQYTQLFLGKKLETKD